MLFFLAVCIYINLTRKAKKMKNWKTTLGGILLALGQLASQSPNEKIHTAGLIATMLGGAVLGVNAQDAPPAQAKP